MQTTIKLKSHENSYKLHARCQLYLDPNFDLEIVFERFNKSLSRDDTESRGIHQNRSIHSPEEKTDSPESFIFAQVF